MLAIPSRDLCRVACLAAMMSACAALAGCRQHTAVDSRVHGIVTYGGAPLREGRVTLLGEKGRVAAGIIQPDGTYEIVDPPPGKVRVGIMTFPKQRKQPLDIPLKKGLASSALPAPAQVHVPERYTAPERSDLSFLVTPGVQVRDLHLARGPADPPVVEPDRISGIGPAMGQQAPEIEGEDLDGQPFKLSDYRGQVVVLVFWAHW